jgi:glycosyltransferase involved in cell wall biosynthesis
VNHHDRELLSIIVPVYNEVRTVLAVIERLQEIDLPVAREIVIVNDGSTDGTREVLDAGLALAPSAVEGLAPSALEGGSGIRVIHVSPNAGKGAAIRRGFSEARGTIVAIQDADLELDPQQLSTLLAPILRGDANVVYGSRFLAGRPDAPWMTIAGNRALTAVTNVLFGASITDMETCYKIMRTEVARSLALDANRFDIEPQVTARLLRAGHRIHELPVKFDPRSRAQGKKIGWRDGVRALEVLVRERFRKSKSQIPSSKSQIPSSKSQVPSSNSQIPTDKSP